MKKISLYEYLYGVDFYLTHLSGKVIRICKKEQIRFPIYRIEGMGLPSTSEYEKGDLLIYLRLDHESINRELIYKLSPPIEFKLMKKKINPKSKIKTVNIEPYLTDSESSIISFASEEENNMVDSITILDY